MKKAVIILQSTVIVIFGIVLINKYLGDKGEERYYVKYSTIKNKDVMEMTEEEWAIKNWVLVDLANKLGEEPDTISFDEAINEAVLNAQEELNRQNQYRALVCSKGEIMKAFHDMMQFNMPYARYDKKEVKSQQLEDCQYHINVTTRDSNNWKTFWVFEVLFNESEDKYNMNTIKSEFLGF